MLFHWRIPFMQSALKNRGLWRYCVSLSNTDSIPKVPQIDRDLSKLSNLGNLKHPAFSALTANLFQPGTVPQLSLYPPELEGGGMLELCMQMPAEARRWYRVPWSWTYRQLWTTLCGGWEPNWSSTRAVCTVNCRATSPAPGFFFNECSQLFMRALVSF